METKTRKPKYPGLPEISEEDFCSNIDREDFIQHFGNPVIIHSGNQRDLICMTREFYERQEEELEIIKEKSNIKYWIFQFQMSFEKEQELKRVCAQMEMTMDEFFEAAVNRTAWYAEHDPEGLERSRKAIEDHPEQEGEQIELVRYYPVFRGETEAQALKRKLSEEANENHKEEQGLKSKRHTETI